MVGNLVKKTKFQSLYPNGSAAREMLPFSCLHNQPSFHLAGKMWVHHHIFLNNIPIRGCQYTGRCIALYLLQRNIQEIL